jgi:hypothetical protein
LSSKVRKYKPIGPVVFSIARNATSGINIPVERAVQGERLPGEATPQTPAPHERLHIYVYELPPEFNTGNTSPITYLHLLKQNHTDDG